MENAIERWQTIELPSSLSLQTLEERQMEIDSVSRYQQSPEFKRSWMEWIQAGATANQALEFLSRNGLFHDQYVDQQRGLRAQAFKKSKQQETEGDKRQRGTPTDDLPPQHYQKKARSSSQANTTIWRPPNVVQNWYQQQSYRSQQQAWSTQHHWKNAQAHTAPTEPSSTQNTTSSNSTAQGWPSYSTSASSSSNYQTTWTPSSASTSQQNWHSSRHSSDPLQHSWYSTYNHSDVQQRIHSRDPTTGTDGGRSAGSSTRQQLPDDMFQ
jgi:hypothetical protein